MHDLKPAQWRKSSRSAAGNACIEITGQGGRQAVRDSKDPAGPVLRFSPTQWGAFTAAISRGQFG